MNGRRVRVPVPALRLLRPAMPGSRPWLRPGPPGPAPAPLLIGALCAAYTLGAGLGWGSEELALVMGDFGLCLAALAAAVSCLRYARSRTASVRPAWLLFGLSSLMAAFGNAVWGWYEVVLGQEVPSPSWADLFFLCFAPPAIVGLLVLAKRPATRAGWVCLGLDAWLIGGSLLTLSWSLALAHTAHTAQNENGASVAHTALLLAYPLLDIALVSMVLALHLRRTGVHRPAVNAAVGALALTVLCDALFTSPLLHESYRSGRLLDAGWFAGSLLLACAPWLPARSAHPADAEGPAGHGAPHPATTDGASGRSAPRPGSLAALTPYLAAGVCTVGILCNVLDGRRVDRVVLLTACTVVLALVVRQGIMLLENIGLARELAHKESHFRSLVQGSSDVIMIAAPSGVLRYVSPAARGVYGREAGELVGSELAALIHPADLGRVVHELRRFLGADPLVEPTTRIECRFRSGQGQWLNVESTVNRHEGGLILNTRDVTERVRLQAQLQHNAEHDPLTDLPNRALFSRRVGQALAGRRSGDAGTAVLFIDLDGFKAVNDTVGHQAGDELLVRAAQRLRESIRRGDTAARFGGDEFAALVLGDGVRDRELRRQHIMELADRLRRTLSQPYPIDGNDVRVAASIGVAFADDGVTAGELLRNADLAMYRAKAGGKNRVELYVPQMKAEALRKVQLAERLRGALTDGEFALLHQPVVNLEAGRIAAVSAHARWRSGQGVLDTPDRYLRGRDAARADDLDGWVLRVAVAQAAERAARGGPVVPVVVRVGARRLLDTSKPQQSVEALLTRHRLPCGSLILELADTDPGAGRLEELERRLTALRRLGVRIALDGFGGGHTSVNALRRLPVDVLKLDRPLVEGVADSARMHKITQGLLRIAGDLGMRSVADGLEHPDQVVALRSMGCTHGQGPVFCGVVDEYRLRRMLAAGPLPVPHSGAEHGMLSRVPAPYRPGAGRSSHHETPVPPT